MRDNQEHVQVRYKGQLLEEKDTYLGDTTDPLTLNRYAYVKNSPLNYIDPTGHDWNFDYVTGEYITPPDTLSQDEQEREMRSYADYGDRITGVPLKDRLSELLSGFKDKLSASNMKYMEKMMQKAVDNAEIDSCNEYMYINNKSVQEFLTSMLAGAVFGYLKGAGGAALNELLQVLTNGNAVSTKEAEDALVSMVGNKTGFYIGEVFGDIVGLISLLKNFLVGTGAAAGAALTIAGPGGAVVTLGAGVIAVSIAGGISIQCIVNDTLSAGGSLGEDVGDELEEGKNKGDSEAGDIDLDKKPTANSSKLQNFINSLYKG